MRDAGCRMQEAVSLYRGGKKSFLTGMKKIFQHNIGRFVNR